ncbi:MAG: SusC/RagA family TonB-linked outer membrane protein, partial [Bacteroidota bacterium]
MKKLSLAFMLVLCTLCTVMAQRNIQGTVTDEEGEALIGATVSVPNTATGTITDFEGKYSLSVPDGTKAIQISYTGYKTTEIQLGTSNTLDVTMGIDAVGLEDVVIVGYGEGSRKTNTTAIASIGTEAFKDIPVQSFQGALSGRLPGVVINQSSGTLGAQSAIRIRGVGSINASNQPLIVIDGLILSDQVSGTGFGGPGTNPLININPNDIESVDVLKDAAATAIYGSRGANGVIIITTKRGDFNQAPTVRLNYYAGYSDPTNTYDLLSGPEYVSIWNNGIDAIGGNPGLKYDETDVPDTDWYDLVTQTGFLQEMSASVSGGSATTSYYIGGTYRDEDGYVVNTNLKRYSLRATIDQMVGKKGKVGVTVNTSRSQNRRAGEDNAVASPFTFGALANPNTNSVDENGVPLVFLETNIPVFNGTPLSNIQGSTRDAVTTQLLVSTYAEYKPFENFKIRTEFASESTQLQELGRELSTTTDGFPNGTAFGDNEQLININWTNLLEYKQAIGDDQNVRITLGNAITRERFDGIDVSGLNFADDRLATVNSAAEINDGGGERTDFSFAGFFARVNYDYGSRYYLTLAGRYDGSSRFGTNNRWGFFPAVSGAWLVSNESFFNSSSINFLKLRASWGQSGNGEIDNFDSRGLAAFGRDYNGNPGFGFDQLENSDLSWEKNTQIDAALEFEVLNRISGSIGYFRRTTTDALLDVPQPREIGIENAVLLQNIGDIENQGFEFEVKFDIVKKKDFTWNIGFNGATLQNEVTKLTDNDGDGKEDDIITGQHIIRTGETLGSFYLVEYAGVDPNNGDALFFDGDGETILVNDAPGSARIVAGDPIPDLTGGITTQFNYKGLDFSAFFQFATGHQLYWSDGRFVEMNFSSLWNQTTAIRDAWTPQNTDTN